MPAGWPDSGAGALMMPIILRTGFALGWAGGVAADFALVAVGVPLAGAELLIYPTAIGFDPNDTPEEQQRQREAWTTIQRGHAVANGLPVVSVNRVGFESDPSGQTAGARFWGGSFVAGCQGEIMARLGESEEDVLVVEIDRRRGEAVRRIWPFLRDRRIDAYNDLLKRYRD